MKNKRLQLPISKVIGCLLFLLTACQGNIIYHSYQPINQEGWYRNDTLIFYLDSCLTNNTPKELQVGIRHTDSYSYKDIWIGLLPINKDSVCIGKTDSIHLYLTNPNGAWKGTGIGESKLFTHTSSYLPETDSIFGFKIIHLMQDTPLRSISNVGIRLAE